MNTTPPRLALYERLTRTNDVLVPHAFLEKDHKGNDGIGIILKSILALGPSQRIEISNVADYLYHRHKDHDDVSWLYKIEKIPVRPPFTKCWVEYDSPKQETPGTRVGAYIRTKDDTIFVWGFSYVPGNYMELPAFSGLITASLGEHGEVVSKTPSFDRRWSDPNKKTDGRRRRGSSVDVLYRNVCVRSVSL